MLALSRLDHPKKSIERALEKHAVDDPELSGWTRPVIRGTPPIMLFCPTCANILTILRDDSGLNKWSCATCPYEFPIDKQMTTRTKLKRKEIDDVMGGEDSWKNVDSTDGEWSRVGSHSEAARMVPA